jgi:chromosome segregation ATPase
MRLRSSSRGEEELEPALKRPLVDLEQTVKGTRRGVNKSRRVQERVKQEVASLRQNVANLTNVKEQLEKMQVDLRTELQETVGNLEAREEEIQNLKNEMNKLRAEHEKKVGNLGKVAEYKQIINEELQKQIEQLVKLNTDIDVVSDGYLALIENEEDQKTVYIDYISGLLEEASRSVKEIEEARNYLLQEKTYNDLRAVATKIENLLDSTDNYQTKEFAKELQKFVPLQESAPKKRK